MTVRAALARNDNSGSAFGVELRELAVVEAREEEQRGYRADERHEHVPLGVPDVALSAEERVGGRAAEDGGEPFDQLVGRAHREADADDEKGEPLATLERRSSEQHLAREHGGDEALRDVAK